MQALFRIEETALLWLQENLRGPILNGLMQLLSRLGDAGLLWIIVTLILLLHKKTRRTGVFCAASMLLTLLAVNVCIKPLVGRIRPYEVIEGLSILVAPHKDFSFPSGHSANSFACAWVLFRRMQGKKRILPVILAAMISFSRLVVGVHYPSDVLAGAAIGIVLSECALRLPSWLKKAKDSTPPAW